MVDTKKVLVEVQFAIARSHLRVGSTYLAIARSQVIIFTLQQVMENVSTYNRAHK